MIYVYVIPSSDVTQPKIVPIPGADEGDYIPEIWDHVRLDGVLYLCTAVTFDHDEEEVRIGLEVVDD